MPASPNVEGEHGEVVDGELDEEDDSTYGASDISLGASSVRTSVHD